MPAEPLTVPATDWMVIDAVRYVVGRMSYQVGVTAEWLVANWAALPRHVRRVVRRDLEEEFRRDDACRARGEKAALPLGMDMDRASWEAVRALWRDTPED